MLGILRRGVLSTTTFARASEVLVAGVENVYGDGASRRAEKKSDLRKFAPTYGDATAVRDSVLTFPLSF